MSKNDQPIVRALDLGWGYTKYSYLDRATNSLDFASFPSLAPRHSGVDLSPMSIIEKRDTVEVTVDGTKYEVGPESADLDTNDASRNLNEKFMATEQYKAVFYGALHYIGEAVIDVLVVGLPISNMVAAEKLTSMMIGVHKINATTTVEVKSALVLAQPLGGLYHCASLSDERDEFAALPEEMNLIIDIGYLTLDFLMAKGLKMVENRSGAYNGGVSKVLRSVADSVSAKHAMKYENYTAIDLGLRRRTMKINGKPESMDEHIKSARSILEAPVNYMKNIVGDGADIDNIILIGGGSSIYRKTISQFFPKHELIVVEDAQMCNVRGYQIAGEKHVKKNPKQASVKIPPKEIIQQEEAPSIAEGNIN